MRNTVLELQLPIFEDDEKVEDLKVEEFIAKRISEGVAKGLSNGAVNTWSLLEADLQKVSAAIHALPKQSYGSMDYLVHARSVADPYLATLTIFQNAINFAVARGASRGPEQLISKVDLLGDFFTEIQHIKR